MEIAVHRLEARYHLPPSRVAERARLDRLLPEVFETALELAFERHGVPAEGELLIREIAVPVELRLAQGDGRLLVDWADAVAAAVAVALEMGDERKVVAYAHRRRALVAFAEDVARGRRERMWAFERLGFATSDAAGSENAAALDLARALATEPEAIVPVLEELGKHGLLPALLARFEPEWWPELAARALAALGIAEAIPRLTEPPASFSAPPRSVDGQPAFPDVVTRLRRILAGSPLGRTAITAAGPARRALAVLALAREDRRLLAGLDELKDLKDLDLDLGDPEIRGIGDEPPLAATSPGVPGAPELREAPVQSAAQPAAGSASEATTVSEWGGLLFLLGLVDELGIPDELAAIERPFRWSLYRLGLALIPVEVADPALLVFTGSPPDGPVPFPDEPPPSAAEAALFTALTGRVATALAAALGEPDLELGPALGVVSRVARRRARFVADPGWIEVHLSLDEVSTEVRRAGLDLDPGFLPWLGAVVRFVYG